MNRLFDIYYTTASYLFPMVEEEIGEITSKMKEFFADIGSCPPVPLLDKRFALVWIGTPDTGSGKDFSCVSGKIGLRFLDHEVAD